MTSFKKLVSFLPLALLLAGYAASTPVASTGPGEFVTTVEKLANFKHDSDIPRPTQSLHIPGNDILHRSPGPDSLFDNACVTRLANIQRVIGLFGRILATPLDLHLCVPEFDRLEKELRDLVRRLQEKASQLQEQIADRGGPAVDHNAMLNVLEELDVGTINALQVLGRILQGRPLAGPDTRPQDRTAEITPAASSPDSPRLPADPNVLHPQGRPAEITQPAAADIARLSADPNTLHADTRLGAPTRNPDSIAQHVSRPSSTDPSLSPANSLHRPSANSPHANLNLDLNGNLRVGNDGSVNTGKLLDGPNSLLHPVVSLVTGEAERAPGGPISCMTGHAIP